MKLIKKILLSFLIVLLGIIVTPNVVPELQLGYTVEAASIKISKTKKTLNVGETYTLKIKGTSKKVKWSSSNTKIAKVNSKGKVTTKKAGKVTITAKVGNKKYKCKITVEKPKISKNTKELFIGSTYNLKVKGTSQKVTWSSSNNSVAVVDSRGKVTAIKTGTAKITAKVGNTKYKCKITVKGYDKNIKIRFKETKTSVIAILTNNNSTAISISPKMLFYNKNGKIQSTTSDFNYCFEPNSTCVMEFKSYNTATYTSQPYASYKLNFGTIEKSYYSSYAANKISVKASMTDGSLIATVKNNSGKNLSTINIYCVFYDVNGNAIGGEEHYADCTKKGTTDYLEFDYPYDDNYDTITPASYKVYVNYAYAYKFL